MKSFFLYWSWGGVVVEYLAEGEVFYNLMTKSLFFFFFTESMFLVSDLHKHFLVLSILETSQEDKRRLGRTAVGRNATCNIWYKILITSFPLEKRHLLRKMLCVYFSNSATPQLLAKTKVYLVDSPS